MSHFSVLVPANNEADLFEKLFPFYEYGCVREYDELAIQKGFVVWNDCKNDPYYLNLYETTMVKHVRLETGELVPDDGEHDYPENLERVEVPIKEIYPTIEDCLDKWFEMERGGPNNAHGYWRNPNAKWDWYSVGGRWRGKIDENPCMVAEIDVERLRNEQAESAALEWDATAKVIATASNLTPWELDNCTTEEFLKIREKIRESIFVSDAADDEELDGKILISPEEWYLFTFIKPQKTREEHIQYAYNSPITFACIDTQGIWRERGEMGWWGIVHDENDNEYGEEFWKFFNSLPPDQLVYLVDCHI